MTAQATAPAQSSALPADAAPTPDLPRLTRMITTAGARPQLPVVSPLTGATLGAIPMCTAEDVQLAVERARAAQTAWAALPLKERVKPFIAAHDAFLDARYALADVIQLENGKARLHALEESFDVALNARYYAYHAHKFITPKRVRGAMAPFTQTVEMRHPWGVVGLITPWNYPLNLAISDSIPALIAGNAVVLKPSELTPYSVLAGLEIFRKAGLPDDLFQIVTGDGATAGAALVERADYIMFTGSTGVGRIIAGQCGKRLIACSMELGGKNPAVVLDDADIGLAVNSIADGALSGSGQTCVSFERVYVQDAAYDQFVPRFAERLQSVRMGSNMTDLSEHMGTLTSAAQLAKIQAHVDDAVSKGARVLSGGKARPDLGPYFFEPTLLDNVTPDMALYKDETFGPVVAVYRIGSDADAIAACNDSAYGLHASVYSKDIVRARRMALQLQFGTVGVNENHKVAWASMHSTQGGFKQSGIGRRHGREGITKYTQTQNISVQRLLPLWPGGLLPPKRWDWFFNGLLRLMRRVPGVR